MGDIQSEFVLFVASDRVMNGVLAVPISDAEVNKLLAIEEGHFAEFKAIEILPAELTRTIAALSNAGGELFIGIDENRTTRKRRWRGFTNQEAANAHIQFSSSCSRWEQITNTNS